ncbi:MAG: glyoxylase-like metal-dependent hydrolase (beta-lactamase superfamily II) [Candidatus Latescibacterota bacterium]|jgi:glyoxylase-like metal-dependent hydrolase (beta-lactamase superfamily II)
MRRLQLGRVEVIHIPGGFFRLDGGTMFGVVPKTLWQKQAEADERNRVRLACNCLLVRTPDALVLVDSGFGERLDERAKDIYGVEEGPSLRSSLAQANIAPEDIDLVVFTHLHFDHLAGSLYEQEGELKAIFPRAIHCIQRGELRDALAGRSTMKSSYRPADLRALEQQVSIKLLYGDSELSPYISTFITGGHTEWHQGVMITGSNQRLAYPGELVPTRAHLRSYWNMAYDIFPLQTIERKHQFISDAVRNEWIVAWDHDPDTPWNRLKKQDDHIVAHNL